MREGRRFRRAISSSEFKAVDERLSEESEEARRGMETVEGRREMGHSATERLVREGRN